MFRWKGRRRYSKLRHDMKPGTYQIEYGPKGVSRKTVFGVLISNEKTVEVGKALLRGLTVDQIVQNLDSSKEVVYKLRRVLTEQRGVVFKPVRNYADRWAA